MKWQFALAAAVAVACTAIEALAGEDPSHAASPAAASTLLYLEQREWSQADGARKVSLAADFMRVFCGDPGMPVPDLVACLDRAEGTEPLFGRALSCVAKRQR